MKTSNTSKGTVDFKYGEMKYIYIWGKKIILGVQPTIKNHKIWWQFQNFWGFVKVLNQAML
jgi:hypothetical protein